MDCSNCQNNEKCKQTQDNVTNAVAAWTALAQQGLDALKGLATAECMYAKDPTTLPALVAATQAVFDAFTAVQKGSNPFAPPAPTNDSIPV